MLTSSGRVVIESHLDLSRPLANRKDALQRLTIDGLNAAGQFVLPSVPGTCHATVVDDSFRQRAALVGAHSIDRVELRVVPKDRHDVAFMDDLDRRTLADLIAGGDADPSVILIVGVAHGCSFAVFTGRYARAIPALQSAEMDRGRGNPE